MNETLRFLKKGLLLRLNSMDMSFFGRFAFSVISFTMVLQNKSHLVNKNKNIQLNKNILYFLMFVTKCIRLSQPFPVFYAHHGYVFTVTHCVTSYYVKFVHTDAIHYII